MLTLTSGEVLRDISRASSAGRRFSTHYSLYQLSSKLVLYERVVSIPRGLLSVMGRAQQKINLPVAEGSLGGKIYRASPTSRGSPP